MAFNNNNTDSTERRSTTDDQEDAMDMVDDHPATGTQPVDGQALVPQGTNPPTTRARSRTPPPGCWEVHPTVPVPMHTGYCHICAAYFDHLCQDMAYGVRDLQDALDTMSRKARQLRAECKKKDQEILQLRMTSNGLMSRISHYERRMEGREERQRLIETGDVTQLRSTWEPQAGQKRPAPADAPTGDVRRDQPPSVPNWAMTGGGRRRDIGSSNPSASQRQTGTQPASDHRVGGESQGRFANQPPAESPNAPLGGWPASQSVWSQPQAADGWPIPATGTGGAALEPPPTQQPRTRGHPRRPFHFFQGATSPPPTSTAATGGNTNARGGSGGGNKKGHGTHGKGEAGGQGASKNPAPSARWEVFVKPPPNNGKAHSQPTPPSVVYEATREEFLWDCDDEDSEVEEEEERDVPVRLAPDRFGVINPTNRRAYLTLSYDQYIHWYSRPVSAYAKLKKQAGEMEDATVKVPSPLRVTTPSELSVELHPADDGLWGWGQMTMQPPSDTGPYRIIPRTSPIKMDEGRTMVMQAQASLEGSVERIRLVRVALAARQSSRRTAGEVVVLESINLDLIPPYPPYPGGTPEPSTATFSQVLEFYRANPNGETPRGIRRHGGDPVPDDVEAFHCIRAIGPKTKEKEKEREREREKEKGREKEKEKGREKEKEKDSSPTRDWRLAAARVLSNPMGYESFLTQKRVQPAPPPNPLVPMDALCVPNISDDNIYCHFVINGITIAQARRWRVWATRAHCRVDYPHLPTPTLAPPLLPWPATEGGSVEATTLAGVTPDEDVPMVDPTQSAPQPEGGSGGPTLPTTTGSGGPEGETGGAVVTPEEAGNQGSMEPPPSTQAR
ncbi:hypothetical protein SCHPADRAFT_942952 [Schizopora paradoxa]|uniref:Uncharacterized protein n=1 Tax=Schizopora paradoxa TaxID=27342 RepID=A0A0H2RZT2_9AGAM|nr:hypothetical protein SCHPADRAFT_942952 [Schizopora paradoxa]